MNILQKTLILAISALALTACVLDEQRLPSGIDASDANPATVINYGVVDGCEIRYIFKEVPGSAPNLRIFVARCEGNQSTTTLNYKSGKEKKVVVMASEEERARQLTADNRQQALDKLTPAEKVLLGIQ